MAHLEAQPTQEIFEDIKQAAVEVWNNYDDTYGYRTEKLDRINEIKNYADNWYTFIGMFDANNQVKMMLNIKKPETKKFLEEQWIHYRYVNPVVATNTEESV